MATSPDRIRIQEIGDVTVVNFADCKLLDEQAIHDIGKELFELAQEHDQCKLLLDLTSVEYLSSAALAKFIALHIKVGGRLVLCNMDDNVRQVFRLAKLDRLFDIREWDAEDDPLADLDGIWSRLKPPAAKDGEPPASPPPPDLP
jgi:anti-sigma B factor antagonist